MISIKFRWFIVVALILMFNVLVIYNYMGEEKFSLKEIAQTIDTEIYYRQPPVNISFGDGYYISDKYKNVIVNRWKGKDIDELRLERSKDWLGYPYRYHSLHGMKYEVNFPAISDSAYWISKDPNLSTFANDFEIELNRILQEKDSFSLLIKALNFITFDPFVYCQPDLFQKPLNISRNNGEYLNYLFQTPGTGYYFIISIQKDLNDVYQEVKVFPWWKDKVRSHGL